MTAKTHPPKDCAAEDIVTNIEAAAEHAGRYARKVYEQTAESSDALTTAIREEPVKAAFIALGIGVLIGAIIRR